MIVTVTVKNRQTMDGETDVTTLSACGNWENGVLTYGTNEDGVTDRTRLTVGETVQMERTGALSSRLIFEKGVTHRCPYGTPYGTLELLVTTHRMVNRLTQTGGSLQLIYTLNAGGAPIENEIEIVIKEVS